MIFTNVVKPTHLCNLSCSYCYNDDVRDPVMTDKTLQRVIGQTFRYVRHHHPGRELSFIWHGGEPMVAGLPFFEQVVSYQDQQAEGMAFSNSIQTNGTLIDDAWLEFFRAEDFSVSISIDGPAELHDRYRVDRGGHGSFDRVMAAIEAVQEAELPLGVCVVLSRANIDHVEEIYDFLTAHHLPFNIIPLNRSGAARDRYEDLGLDAEEYAPAWIKMYDRWLEADDDYVYCSDFVFKTRAVLAGRPADCIGLEQCSETNISVDPVGDVYGCATLSGHADTRYGNLVDQSLREVMDSSVARAYRNRPTDPQCSRCRWQHVCHGGCLARAYKFFGNHGQRDYYCSSLFRIYEHIALRMRERVDFPAPPAMQPPHDSRASSVAKPAAHRRTLPIVT